MREISAPSWFYYKKLKPVSLAIRIKVGRRETFKNFFFRNQKNFIQKGNGKLNISEEIFDIWWWMQASKIRLHNGFVAIEYSWNFFIFV